MSTKVQQKKEKIDYNEHYKKYKKNIIKSVKKYQEKQRDMGKWECKICNHKYSNGSSFSRHLKSKKHAKAKESE